MKARQATLIIALLVSVRLLADDFDFVVIGDARPRFESESFQPFESLITKINTMKPARVIYVGDLIYGYGTTRKEMPWDKYQAVIKTIQVPYYGSAIAQKLPIG